MDNPEKLKTLGKKAKKTTTQKIEKMSNTNLTKNRWWIQAPAKTKQILPPMRHPSCYSYSRYVLDTTILKNTQIK